MSLPQSDSPTDPDTGADADQIPNAPPVTPRPRASAAAVVLATIAVGAVLE